MRESFWGVFIIGLGVVTIVLMFHFQTLTNTDEHNYTLLKETTEAAMIDSFDIATYNSTGNVRIDREKFVESFLRRFAQSASLANEYRVEIYDVNEYPPKVSIRISSRKTQSLSILPGQNDTFNFSIINRLDAILETPY